MKLKNIKKACTPTKNKYTKINNIENTIMKTKGFKATNPNMICRDFQFEIGKKFKHEGKIQPCRSGFHFCEKNS